MAVIPHAYAASVNRNCFETKTDAQQFVVNLRAYEASYHETENKRRKLLAAPGQSYRSLLYSLRDLPNVMPDMTLGDPKFDKMERESEISHYIHHKHLMPSDVKLNETSQYCSKTHSEVHTFIDVWTVDVAKNLVLTSNTYTEIAR